MQHILLIDSTLINSAHVFRLATADVDFVQVHVHVFRKLGFVEYGMCWFFAGGGGAAQKISCIENRVPWTCALAATG